MLKGHTKIELTNVKTGEKRTYEKDNFVTNFFRDAMQPCGVYGDLQQYFFGNKKTAKNTLLEMTRGIVFFDSALPDDPDQYTLPAGVNMIGRGTDAAYNGQDTTLGSYNASESVIENDGTNVGYRYVWDFTTQQANGTIKSICLTPTGSAKIGFGKSNVVLDNNEVSLWSKILNANYSNGTCYPRYNATGDQKNITWVDFSKNRLLRATSGFTDDPKATGNLFVDKSITLSEYRMPINTRSIFDSYNYSERANMTADKTYVVSMPGELQALCTTTNICRGYSTRVDHKNGILSIILLLEEKCSVPVDGTIYVWEINLNEMTSTVKTYVNNTGYIIGNSDNYRYRNSRCIHELDDYILVYIPKSTGTQKLCCIDKNSGACKDITLMDGSAIPFKNDGFFDNGIRTGNLMICTRSNFIDSTKITEYFIIDCVTGTLKNIEIKSNNGSIGSGSYGYFYDYEIFSEDRKYMMYQEAISYLYPFVFFTINNLDTPIEKTDEQAMKITYELTKE